MLPKRSPSVVKTLSVLPSVREHSGHGQDPLANDRQGALDDYDDPRAFQNKSPLNYLWTVNMIWLFPLFHDIPLSEIWSSTSDVCVLSRYRQGCFTRSREIISQWPSHTLRSFTEIISPSGPSKSIQYIWMNKSRSWLLWPSTSFQYPKVSPL